jgi:hypothetical protein
MLTAKCELPRSIQHFVNIIDALKDDVLKTNEAKMLSKAKVQL